jgi:hypothetical protein
MAGQGCVILVSEEPGNGAGQGQMGNVGQERENAAREIEQERERLVDQEGRLAQARKEQELLSGVTYVLLGSF